MAHAGALQERGGGSSGAEHRRVEAELTRLKSLAAHIARKRLAGRPEGPPATGAPLPLRGRENAPPPPALLVVGRGAASAAAAVDAERRARRRHRRRLARIVADQWLWVARLALRALPKAAALRHRKLAACFQARRATPGPLSLPARPANAPYASMPLPAFAIDAQLYACARCAACLPVTPTWSPPALH